jgi:hypothetical protein
MKKISSSLCSSCVHGMCMIEEKSILLQPPQISDNSSIEEVMERWDKKINDEDDDDEDVSYQHVTSQELLGEELTSICYYPSARRPSSDIVLKFGPILQCSHFEKKK